VLHVSDFQFNLLSVHKLCAQITGKVIFSSTNCILQCPMLQEMVLGKASNGLYHIQNQAVFKPAAGHDSLVLHTGIPQDTSQALLKETVTFSELDSWHFRLGHLSFDRMRHINLPCNNKKSKMQYL